MKNIMLVIRLKGGHFVALPFEESKARQILTKFVTGIYKLQGPSYIGDTAEGWGVDTLEISAITLEPLPVQTTVLTSGSFKGVSGW